MSVVRRPRDDGRAANCHPPVNFSRRFRSATTPTCSFADTGGSPYGSRWAAHRPRQMAGELSRSGLSPRKSPAFPDNSSVYVETSVGPDAAQGHLNQFVLSRSWRAGRQLPNVDLQPADLSAVFPSPTVTGRSDDESGRRLPHRSVDPPRRPDHRPSVPADLQGGSTWCVDVPAPRPSAAGRRERVRRGAVPVEESLPKAAPGQVQGPEDIIISPTPVPTATRWGRVRA